LAGLQRADAVRRVELADLGHHRVELAGLDVRDVDLHAALELRELLAQRRRAQVAADACELAFFVAECGLDDEVRNVISKGRITTDQWIDVVTTAHELGIRTTSTIMYGHVESYDHWAKHMATLRSIQSHTGGFTEFVPLSFVHQEAPMVQKSLVRSARRGATSEEVVKMHAVARLFLGASFANIQVSWVKEGPEMARRLLACGANDLGGTLINESISTSAGAAYGQLLSPIQLRKLIRSAGRVPAERTSLYAIRKVFDDEADESESALDRIDDADARFGSYATLSQSTEFRFEPFARKEPPAS